MSIVQERLRQQLTLELGPLLTEALDDSSILNILLNADGQVWVDRLDEGMQPLAGATLSPDRAESFLGTVAALSGLTISRDRPILEATLADRGYRIAGVLPPVVAAPVFAIRKPTHRVFALEQLVAEPFLSLLREALIDRRNILISGMTSSGKTTLANSLVRELEQLFPNERLVVLEDSPELRLSAANALAFATSEGVSLARLVRTTLRFQPVRIVIGEVRGSEAFDLLKAWTTGHPGGIATVHANGAAAALERLDLLAQEANVQPQARLVAEAVDLVVHVIPRSRIGEVFDVKRGQLTSG